MKYFLPLVLSFTIFSLPASAEESQRTNLPQYKIDGLYEQISRVVRTHYPEATSHQLNDKIHFEYQTRLFIVHLPDRMGGWQDPHEMRGPDQLGIMADLQVNPGRWGGAAVVPQAFDRYYFTDHLLAPYSERLDAHLRINLSYPREVPDGFLADIFGVFNDFDQYVEPIEKPHQ